MLDPLFRRDPQVVTYPSIEGPPLTDEMVAAAERELGVVLPLAYVELMRSCNGGYTRSAALPTTVPTTWAPDHVQVRSLNGIPAVTGGDALGVGDGILMSAYMTAEWGLPEGLVLLDGEGHFWIALDYRRSGPAGPPSVVWIDADEPEDIPIAESFEALLAGLVPEDTFFDD